MKIILSQVIGLKESKRDCFLIKKEYESNIIPQVGWEIYDSLWKDPSEYEVIQVILNYKNNECQVALSSIKLEGNKEYLKEWYDLVKLHGWETIGEIY